MHKNKVMKVAHSLSHRKNAKQQHTYKPTSPFLMVQKQEEIQKEDKNAVSPSVKRFTEDKTEVNKSLINAMQFSPHQTDKQYFLAE